MKRNWKDRLYIYGIAGVFLGFLIVMTIQFRELEKRPHYIEQRTAQFVREHHCQVVASRPSAARWDSVEGKVENVPGYKDYECPGVEGLIIIRDNEAQP